MRSFKDVRSFVQHLSRLPVAIVAAEKAGLEAAAVIIEREAKAEIGHYQGAIGGFEAWQDLADATKADRVAAGFPADNPLLRSGELLESISHSVEGNRAVIGSTSDIAVYQELGTVNAPHPIPPRSFLGGAAMRKGEDAANAIGKAVAYALAGKTPPKGR